MISRGEIYIAELGLPIGSSPGFKRPVLVLQSDLFNESKIGTVIASVLTSNVDLANAPGNVFIKAHDSGLKKDSVINISQIVTVDKVQLTQKISKVRNSILKEVEDGIRLILNL